MNIAFIGLGNMGRPMAHNLLKAGHSVRVFDIVPLNVEALVTLGATAASSVRAAVGDVGMVITMLPSSSHVRSVYLDSDGVLANIGRDITLIDSSTIDPHTARDVAAAARNQGNPMADAPVSGGTAGAQNGTLTFMVGADKALYERISPILALMGKNIIHCGAVGTGQVAKICNNLLLGISMLGVAEAMSLGAALGIEPKTLAGIINSSSGRCWSSDTYNPYPGVMENVPAARAYSGGFGTDLMLKDLALATDAARQAKQPVVMGAAAHQLFQLWSSQGAGGLDFSSIINLVNRTGTTGRSIQ
jgi:3-hydroxyisobutyrate dehydrogenase